MAKFRLPTPVQVGVDVTEGVLQGDRQPPRHRLDERRDAPRVLAVVRDVEAHEPREATKGGRRGAREHRPVGYGALGVASHAPGSVGPLDGPSSSPVVATAQLAERSSQSWPAKSTSTLTPAIVVVG